MRQIRNTSVAVVGGAGFLGSHLVDHLIDDRDCSVLVVDNLVAGRRDFVHSKAAFEHHDITGSEDHLRRLFERYGVKYVFNFAAYPYVPDSYYRPLQVFEVNANGAMRVINAAHEAGCEGILQVSSAEIYGGEHYGSPFNDGFEDKIEETFAVTPHSTYGIAKAAIDTYCQVAWRERKVPVIALRQFNCIGERDEAHPYVIPEIMRQLDQQTKMALCDKCGGTCERDDTEDGLCHDCMDGEVYSNVEIGRVQLGNNSYRDFLYAGDQARMATELLERGEFGLVYNLGSEEGVKIYDLAEMIGRLMGFESLQVEMDPERVRPWEIWWLLSDNTKIYSAIDARPQVSLNNSLKRTLQYFESTNWRFAW